MRYSYMLLICFMLSASIVKPQSKAITTPYKDIKNAIEIPPEYPGGIDSFVKFIEEEFHPPDTFASSEAEDKLLVSFVIEKDGSLTDIVIIKDLGYGTGDELMRVLKLSKKWKPGVQDGRAVRVAFTLPVQLPLPEIKIDEPIPEPTQFSLIEPTARAKTLKLSPITLVKQRYLFFDKFSKCMQEDYHFESGRQALSDRYSIIQQVGEDIAADSLKKVIGRICFEVLLDTIGQPCVLSLKNELNVPSLGHSLKKAVETKTKWKVIPAKGRKNEPVSAILVFSFTQDRIYYRHMIFNEISPALIELEASEKGKFTKY